MVKFVRTGQELLDCIFQIKEQIDIRFSDIEKNCNFSCGSISKWKKNDPGLSKVMKVLDFLGIDVILKPRTDNLKFNPDASQIEHPKIENKMIEDDSNEIDIDVKLLSVLIQIFKNSNLTVSDKEKLYNILKVFL